MKITTTMIAVTVTITIMTMIYLKDSCERCTLQHLTLFLHNVHRHSQEGDHCIFSCGFCVLCRKCYCTNSTRTNDPSDRQRELQKTFKKKCYQASNEVQHGMITRSISVETCSIFALLLTSIMHEVECMCVFLIFQLLQLRKGYENSASRNINKGHGWLAF